MVCCLAATSTQQPWQRTLQLLMTETYKNGGKNINFFVRTDGSGKLQAHFDACYSCFKYKLGYVREGNQVVCIACRIGYNLDEVVWDYVGACAPINLKSGIAGNHLVIKRSRLEKAKRFF